MSFKIETPEIKIMLIFSNVDINVDHQSDKIDYWINLANIYMQEKE